MGSTLLVPLDFWGDLPFETNWVRSPAGDVAWVVASLPPATAGPLASCHAWGSSFPTGGPLG